MENELLIKINERLDNMGKAFLELRQHIPMQQDKRYHVPPHASDATDQIDTAHALSLAELKNVARQSTTNRGTYAKIEHCCEALNPILTKFDLSVKQLLSYNEHGKDTLITRLSHKSGQWYEAVSLLREEKGDTKNKNQSYGESITYMRRYAFLAIVGVGQIDDPTDLDR